jgi:Zn-dependent protease
MSFDKRVRLLSFVSKHNGQSANSSSSSQPVQHNWFRRLIGSVGGGALAVLKFGWLILKLGTFKGALITMAISLIFYSFLFGPLFAIGFILLMGIHEMGHWLMAKRQGIATSFPIFIPGLGALINMRQQPASVKQEAQMATAGPLVGGLASFGMIGLGYLTHYGLWAALGYTGCFMNLFNLLPVTPLDGGRIMTALSRWMNLVGLVLLGIFIVIMVFWLHDPYALPILLIVAIVGVFELFRRFRGQSYQPQYFNIPLRIRLLIASAWVAMAIGLSWGIYLSVSQLAALSQMAKV